MIYNYYDNFGADVYTYNRLLEFKSLFSEEEINLIDGFARLIDDVVLENNGLEILADLTYIGSSMRGASFEEVQAELIKKMPRLNKFSLYNFKLQKRAWKYLSSYHLVHPVEENVKVRRLVREDK